MEQRRLWSASERCLDFRISFRALEKIPFLRDVQKLILDTPFMSNQTSLAEQMLLADQSLDPGTFAQPCS